MKTGIVVALLIAIAVIGSAMILIKHYRAERQLSADEQTIQSLAHEVYDGHITAEAIKFVESEAILSLSFKDGTYKTLEIDLSSLARKHRDDGLSLASIKRSLKLDFAGPNPDQTPATPKS